MNTMYTTVDLTNCDREPIHLLGRIQPFGALVAVNADWMVAQYSENFDAILDAQTTIAPGMRIADLFLPEAVGALRATLGQMRGSDSVERIFGLILTVGGAPFDVAVHSTGPLTIIEIEPHDAAGFASHVGTLRAIMAELETCGETMALCREAAGQMKRLLGFDRVMVYKFHEDLSGEVVAEAREPHLESYFGLRYPKTDIPAQARALYLRNPFRIISDVNEDGVPILPGVSIEGAPIDLSLSTLRAVSPIHLEYLRNMGVEASLSISIVVRGKLWGLFACHHYAPRVLPYSLRTVAELFSQLFSLLLDRVLTDTGTRLSAKGRELHDRLMARLAGGVPLLDSLPTLEAVIGDIVQHDGSSIYIDGVYKSRGCGPTEEQFMALIPALNSASTSRVFASNELAARIPAAQAFADKVVGAMVVPVSRRPRDYFVLWRRELPQVVTWAGNPEKPVEYGPSGSRLTPRKSFEAWQQSVNGKSAEWAEDECQIAESLRVTLLEVILRLTDEAVQDRARAQEQQELLIAELNHRVRNILNLIRSLISQTRREATDVASFSDLIGGRIGALATAHDHITKGNWSPASFKDLVADEARAYLGGKEDRVSVNGDDVLIAPEAYTVVALVMHEMMTNSVKYGALCDSRGTIAIDLSRDRNGDLEIAWTERGGPAVQAPQRRGFGSTITERSIPYELRGEAQVQYKLGGVEARFVIPQRFVRAGAAASGDGAGAGAAKATNAAAAPGEIPEHVLVVEDSMIIAMDTEDSLRSLGVKTVTTASNVNQALASIEQDPPELAILDYNLGTETSDPVAAQLRERGIPFVMASGYGELEDSLDEFGAFALLKKPYGKAEIAAVLGRQAA
ncbi:Bacteriophytochrome [Tsuneonella dongtanensis]|uniref:histidine kinase n=1 Tax=Tsuneonella dongtanensis TaxID=692370 RepID=A0A1B2A958_9SPHN|nr:HWE histidine kinase domain-containing protein [Tsuneonella dongtanensis]ANY18595.1 Bacteriophytochrome [Tsuneonella dongtanensis]